jgi:hypothetical protein
MSFVGLEIGAVEKGFMSSALNSSVLCDQLYVAQLPDSIVFAPVSVLVV